MGQEVCKRGWGESAALAEGGGDIHVGGVRGGSHSVTAGGGAAPRVRAAKSSEFEEEKL